MSVASILTAASGGSGPTAAAAAQEAAPPFAEPTVPATATDDKARIYIVQNTMVRGGGRGQAGEKIKIMR